jgi:peptidoglycan/LPS O-acetylase OafA/YrhL
VAQDSYRPDIDGLRALAVVSVMLFHAGFETFPGGFLGVDVFFVISGFLITRLIAQQVSEHRFSFAAFYLRRARRLLPALVVTIALTVAASCVLLAPLHLSELADSAVASNFSVSNIYFYRQSGYFDSDAIFKPLLHTWSLSVEEQFYLVWPAILVFLIGRAPGRLTPLLVFSAGGASLLLTEHYRVNTSAIFFLAPFRVFEFALGALMVWIVRAQPRRAWLAEILLSLGLALIVSAVLQGDSKRSFSEVNTVLPCFGAALVIHSGRARYVGWLLRNRLAVGVGLISYSLYLVHWPLIVLLKYDHFEPFSSSEKCLVLLCALGVAGLLYRFVERRFRHRDRTVVVGSDRRFVVACACGIATICAVAIVIRLDGGLLHRYPALVREQIRPDRIEADKLYTWKRFTERAGPFDADDRRKILIVGDSQAADFVNVLGESGLLDKTDVRTIRLDRQCQSLISQSAAQFAALGSEDQATCKDYYARWTDLPDLRRAEVVVLAFAWYDRGIPFIGDAVTALLTRGVRTVAVIGRKSQGYSGVDVILQYGIGNGADRFSAQHRNKIAWSANAEIEALPRRFIWVDPMSQICSTPDACQVFDDAGNILFFDGSHLTPAGAKLLGQRLLRSGSLDFLRAR